MKRHIVLQTFLRITTASVRSCAVHGAPEKLDEMRRHLRGMLLRKSSHPGEFGFPAQRDESPSGLSVSPGSTSSTRHWSVPSKTFVASRTSARTDESTGTYPEVRAVGDAQSFQITLDALQPVEAGGGQRMAVTVVRPGNHGHHARRVFHRPAHRPDVLNRFPARRPGVAVVRSNSDQYRGVDEPMHCRGMIRA